MKSELSFLLELILDDEIAKPLKAKLVARIREVEKNYSAQQIVSRGKLAPIPKDPIVAMQSPSMQRLMADNPNLIPCPITPAVPVTPQAANALASRQALMNRAGNEKPLPGMTSPKKI